VPATSPTRILTLMTCDICWAINAGFEISLACDMLLASPGAKFLVGLGGLRSPHDVNRLNFPPACVELKATL